MAHSFNTNSIPATGSAAMYLLITTLVAAGWTKTSDSDGTTYSSSGTQITGGGSGANGLANNSAWFVMRDPASARQWCFQRGTTNYQWRVKYSYAAGFSGGSPSATQVPSATDEYVLAGAGTDASPTFINLLPTTDGSYRFNCCAGDSTAGYGFFFFTFGIAAAYTLNNAFGMEVMASGTFTTGDLDPAICFMGCNADNLAFTNMKLVYQYSATQRVMGLWNPSGIPTFAVTQPFVISDAWQPSAFSLTGYVEQGGNNSNGTNSWTGKDDVMPVCWGRLKGASSYGPACNTFGWKGVGQLLKHATNFRANMDTLSVGAGSKNYVWFNGYALPWDGSTPVI